MSFFFPPFFPILFFRQQFSPYVSSKSGGWCSPRDVLFFERRELVEIFSLTEGIATLGNPPTDYSVNTPAPPFLVGPIFGPEWKKQGLTLFDFFPLEGLSRLFLSVP